MSAFTKYNGIAFTELDRDFLSAKGIKYKYILSVNVEISGRLLTQTQLMGLNDVKERLSCDVIKLGGNAVIEFKYGQKSVGVLESIVNLDDIIWYGSGVAVFIFA